MRILIVDDDMVGRNKLELIMGHFGDCNQVNNGKDALAAFHEAHRHDDPFDLIMLDIYLPDMDGVQVLSTLRNTEKELNIDKERQAKILITTSCRDRNKIIACVQAGCDDYIGKPFNLNLIRNKLDKLGIKERSPSTGFEEISTPASTTTDQIYGEVLAMINEDQVKLPSLPKLYIRFLEMNARKAKFNDIFGLLRKDIAISAEIIRRSNTTYYKGLVNNNSLKEAVPRMGQEAIVQIVNELSTRKFFFMEKGKFCFLIENLWNHSISCAYAAEYISKLLKIDLTGDPFLVGLLHDIGKLALLQIIADLERKGKFNGVIDLIMLVTILEYYHCQMGAKLLDRWKFAECYTQTALNHNSSLSIPTANAQSEKQAAYSGELLVVKLANQIVNLMGYDILASGPAEIDLDDVEPVVGLDLKPGLIAKIATEVSERMAEVQDLL